MTYFEEMEARIPKGEVRTRFAPSPTGYMHVGNLRTALYTYLIARHLDGKFILRIEDTDQGRLVSDAVDVIYKTMQECGLEHDEGPDVGGPVAPYIQTERRDTYGKYAKLLVEKGAAYYCFCEKTESEEDSGDFHRAEDPCRSLTAEEVQAKLDAGVPYVIRQKIPHEGTTTFSDAVYGDITVPNAELDDQILLKSDGLPTYNFANVIDDHLMGITHVVRGSEYLSSAPKYNLLYQSFGWDVPTYVHCSSVMIQDAETGAVRKMSKRKGDPSYEDLIQQGYLAKAVVNYVALCGWAPGGEQEIFSMPELIAAFDVKGISKSPAVFDLAKLKWMNTEYIKAMDPDEFYEAALPYLKQAIPTAAIDLKAVAALVQSRCEVLTDLPERVDFLEALPDYDIAMYTHKKMKTTPENSLASLQAILPALEALDTWNEETIHDALFGVVAALEVKNGVVLWPARVAVSGKQSTPGGAVEICALLGKEESLRRIRDGIARLS
jgi:glutamyl-tRNA synthetase